MLELGYVNPYRYLTFNIISKFPQNNDNFIVSSKQPDFSL